MHPARRRSVASVPYDSLHLKRPQESEKSMRQAGPQCNRHESIRRQKVLRGLGSLGCPLQMPTLLPAEVTASVLWGRVTGRLGPSLALSKSAQCRPVWEAGLASPLAQTVPFPGWITCVPRCGRGRLVCPAAGPQAPWGSWASHGDPFGAVGTLAHPGWVLELGATPAPQPAEARACLNLLAS